jgi:phosphoribosylformylglycinamidine cyclo-ligase
LDYFGCQKLDKTQFAQFIEGALAVCRRYGIPLIGGETAEMRGIYQPGEVEVLGILLGVVPVSPLNGIRISKGNYIYGIPSNGAHTNGYTKLREIDASVEGGMPAHIKEFFSQPHKNYIPIVDFISQIPNTRITARCHITGGGFNDNIERVLPSSEMQVQLDKWPLTHEWQWLFDHAGMDWDSFIRVFNAGYGFCIVVANRFAPEIIDYILRNTGERICLLGHII